MPDDDFDLDAEESEEEEAPIAEATPPGELPDWAKREVEKARKEAARYRTELRRLQLSAEFGADVMELVPSALPLKEQRELAAKLKARLSGIPQQAQTAEESPEEEAPAPQPEERPAPAGFAPTAGGAPPAPKQYTHEEFVEIYRTDPARARQLLEQGVVVLNKLPGNLNR